MKQWLLMLVLCCVVAAVVYLQTRKCSVRRQAAGQHRQEGAEYAAEARIREGQKGWEQEAERGMKYVLALLVIAILSVPYKGARAQDACEFLEQGHGYIKVKRTGDLSTYVVTVTGPNWNHGPYGWHAPGYVQCKSCQSGGLYHFGYFKWPRDGAGPRIRPPTAAERVQSAREVVGYPYKALTQEHLEHQASREPISIGVLSGYAVRYKGWLVVSVTDGCIGFETTLQTPPDDDWLVLDSLLSAISVEKKSGVNVRAPAGSIVVRPRRDGGEEPAGRQDIGKRQN